MLRNNSKHNTPHWYNVKNKQEEVKEETKEEAKEKILSVSFTFSFSFFSFPEVPLTYLSNIHLPHNGTE